MGSRGWFTTRKLSSSKASSCPAVCVEALEPRLLLSAVVPLSALASSEYSWSVQTSAANRHEYVGPRLEGID